MLAIDDFGTEYSSLSRLRRLPIDVLKIDKSFVDGIAINPRERAFTAAIVSLAASLGKGTVAEGIETAGQYAQLMKLGVEFGQGYLFAQPVGPDWPSRTWSRSRRVADSNASDRRVARPD